LLSLATLQVLGFLYYGKFKNKVSSHCLGRLFSGFSSIAGQRCRVLGSGWRSKERDRDNPKNTASYCKVVGI
jgi:hypothetical protein